MANTTNGFNNLQAIFKQKQANSMSAPAAQKPYLAPVNAINSNPRMPSADPNKFVHVKRMMKKYLNRNLV